MGSGDQVRLERGIGGEVNAILKKKLNVDMEGVIDPEPLVYIHELREWARETDNQTLLQMLRRAEGRVRAEQYKTIRQTLNDDISKIATAIGHQQRDNTNPLEEMMKRVNHD